jgi:hypothetical protein
MNGPTIVMPLNLTIRVNKANVYRAEFKIQYLACVFEPDPPCGGHNNRSRTRSRAALGVELRLWIDEVRTAGNNYGLTVRLHVAPSAAAIAIVCVCWLFEVVVTLTVSLFNAIDISNGTKDSRSAQ